MGADPAHLHLLERKDAAWLALLALQGSVPRDQVAGWLWPDVPLKTATGSLRQRIFRLRRRLGHELVQAAERVHLLPEVRLLAPQHLPAASTAAGPGSAPLQPPPELLAGYTFADCPELDDWLTQQRHAERQQWLQRLALWADRAEARHELTDALAAARQLAAAEPLSEAAGRRLMRLHYLCGDRAAAVLAFERLEQHLRSELGARPAPATVELLATIEAAAAGPAAPDAGLTAVRFEMPASLLRPPRMVGRNTERAAVQRAWAAGRVVLVLGEAGMGKSRLLADLAVAQGGAAACLLVAARPGDAAVPDALAARLLRRAAERAGHSLSARHRRELARLLPELADGPLPVADGQRAPLQQAAWALLKAARQTGVRVVLLDDLHFADAASLELMQALVLAEGAESGAGADGAEQAGPQSGGSNAVAAPALHWGVAQRADEGDPAAQAFAAALLETHRLHQLTLQPLDEAAVAELIASLGLPELDATTLAPALRGHTGGNPLFVLETLKDMVLQGPAGSASLPQPATVGALIDRRLKVLSTPALALARVAAIAGVDFDIAMAEAVLNTPALMLAEAWTELQSAQVLNGSSFAHDLVLDAVQRSVPPEIGRHVHAAVAQQLQARQAMPARVATHWQAAERWAEAGGAYTRAVRMARNLGRLADAESLAARAADCYRHSGDRAARWRVEVKRAEVRAVLLGPDAAAEGAQQLLAEAADDNERLQALSALAVLRLYRNDWPGTLALAEAAEALLQVNTSVLQRATLERLRGQALSQMGAAGDVVPRLQSLLPAIDEAADRAAQAVSRAPAAAGPGHTDDLCEEADSLQRMRYEFRSSLAYALNQCHRPRECMAVLGEVIALATENRDMAEVMVNRGNRATCAFETGLASAALLEARAAARLREETGLVAGPHALMNELYQATAEAALGHLGDALTRLESLARQRPVLGSLWSTGVNAQSALLWLTLGQWHRAQAQLDEAADCSGAPLLAVRLAALRARLQRLRQPAPLPPELAAPIAQALAAQIERFDVPMAQRNGLAARIELSRLQPPPQALHAVRDVHARALAMGAEGLARHALVRQLDLLMAAEEPSGAAAARDAAAHALLQADPEVVPSDGSVVEQAWVLARWARATGRVDDERHHIGTALAWIDAATATLPAGLHRGLREVNPLHQAVRLHGASLR